jgi:hypothetical protein
VGGTAGVMDIEATRDASGVVGAVWGVAEVMGTAWGMTEVSEVGDEVAV